MKVLLTNDDGIEAEGLQALRRALLDVPGVELEVIAPDGNRSATARSITTRRPLWVERVEFGDGTAGYATDGTPVDCVRLSRLGLIDDFRPDLVVSGINHGLNLGDDITYSGTVAAAFEALLLELPGIAVSQQSTARELDFRLGRAFDFEAGAAFAAGVVAELEDVLELQDEVHDRRLFRIYGDAGGLVDEVGTDIAAVAAGRIAVTPIHFDLTDRPGMAALEQHDLARLIVPAAHDVE
jgi:5'-nucleotidase